MGGGRQRLRRGQRIAEMGGGGGAHKGREWSEGGRGDRVKRRGVGEGGGSEMERVKNEMSGGGGERERRGQKIGEYGGGGVISGEGRERGVKEEETAG